MKTDENGRFSVETTAGHYRECVEAQGYDKECRDILTGDQSELQFILRPTVSAGTPELLDRRIKMIAGPGAVDCGHVQIDESRKRATRCVLSSDREHKAFYVAYHLPGIDFVLISAIASDGKGKAYTVHFDSMGWEDEGQRNAGTLEDDQHSGIIPCPEPVKFKSQQKRQSYLRSSFTFSVDLSS